MSKTATEMLKRDDADMDARMLHDAMERFSYHWAPSEPRKQAEFQADLLLLIQAVHRDAARPFGKMLENAMALMPPMIFPKS